MIKYFLKRIGLELAEKLMLLGIFALAVGIPGGIIYGLLWLGSSVFGEANTVLFCMGLFAIAIVVIVIYSVVSFFKRCWKEAKREKQIHDDYCRKFGGDLDN